MRRYLGPLVGLACFGLLIACPGCPTGDAGGGNNTNQNGNANSNTNDNAGNGNANDNSSNANTNENQNDNSANANANGNENANGNDNSSNDNSSNDNSSNDNNSGTFVDTEMKDWVVLDTLAAGDIPQNDATQVASDGNPAPSRGMTVALDVNASAVIIHVQTDFRLPGATATQNGVALDHLDLALDSLLSYATAVDGFIEGGFVVVQNNVIYRTTSNTIDKGAWQTDSRSGLTATDFEDSEGNHPDFSATGGVLQFGYYRVVTFLHSSVGEDDFADNYTVSATPAGFAP